jgi:hypothetical protein
MPMCSPSKVAGLGEEAPRGLIDEEMEGEEAQRCDVELLEQRKENVRCRM